MILISGHGCKKVPRQICKPAGPPACTSVPHQVRFYSENRNAFIDLDNLGVCAQHRGEVSQRSEGALQEGPEEGGAPGVRPGGQGGVQGRSPAEVSPGHQTGVRARPPHSVSRYLIQTYISNSLKSCSIIFHYSCSS